MTNALMTPPKIHVLPNGTFRVNVRRKNLHYDKTFKTKLEAEAARDELLAKRTEPAQVSFLDAMEQYLVSVSYMSKKENTRRTEKSRLNKLASFFGRTAVQRIDKEQVYSYVSSRMQEKSGNSADAIRIEVRSLSALFNFAVEKRWISDNPAIRVKLPKPRLKNRRLSEQGYGAVQALLGSEIARFRFLARHICLILNTGARPGEWREVREEHLNLGTRPTVLFNDTKTGGFRVVPLSVDSVTLVKEQLNDRVNGLSSNAQSGTDFLFPARHGKSSYAHSGALRDAKDKGLLPKNIRVHDARHEFVSSNVENENLPDSAIMSIVGHSSPASMSRYSSLRNDRFRDQLTSFSKGHRPDRLKQLAEQYRVSELEISTLMKGYRVSNGIAEDVELVYSSEFHSHLKVVIGA